MLKDTEKEKEEEEKKEKERRPGFFEKVPLKWKIAGVVVIFIRYMAIQNSGGDIKQLWFWVGGVLIVWWLMGQTGLRVDSGVLTPKQAHDAVRREIEQRKKDGEIKAMAKVFVGPNDGLQFNDALPRYYQIYVQIHEDNRRMQKKATVFADGPTKGFVTLQDTIGQLTGRETIPVKFPIPNVMREAKNKLDIDFDKMLFGEKK